MADRLRVAFVQLRSTDVKADNLEKADRLVARAASTGADIVLLPEKWNAIGPADVFCAHSGHRGTFGRSMVVDPWGVVLATAPDEDCVVYAEVDRERIERVRTSVPSLANRQPEAYRWAAAI